MDQNGELQANVTKYFSAAALRFKYQKYSRVKGKPPASKAANPGAMYTLLCIDSKRINGCIQLAADMTN